MIEEEFNTELQQWEYCYRDGTTVVCLPYLNRMPLEHVLKAVQKLI